MDLSGLALIALGSVGFLDALYFLLVAYRWMRPDPRWMPSVCRMSPGTCARIVDTREGRLFGVPNALPGLVWYAMMVGAGTIALVTGDVPYCESLLALSLLVLLVTLYLIYALVARLRVVCTLCYLAHAINLGVAVVLSFACR